MSSSPPSLLVVETHPVQYRVPVYRALQSKWGVKVHVIYGSDFSIAGHFDKHFDAQCAWDVDLLSGIDRSQFLASCSEGGAASMDELSTEGLGQAIRNANPDAVLITGYSPVFHLHALYHAMKLDRPIMFRAETIQSQGEASLKRKLRNVLLRHLYDKCDRLLPIGKWSSDHYRELGCAEEKLVFCPYCVDTEPFRCGESARAELRPAARAELGIAADRIVLVFSGKIYEHKRPRLLLQAIRLMPERLRKKIEVLYLGSGPDWDAVRAEAAIEPAVRVSCTGFLGQAQMSPYYHAADLLVLPSKSETWGLVVNEALHHGLPCVVTDTVGSGPDLVHSGISGEIVRGTAEGLADGIASTLALTGSLESRSRCRAAVAGYTVDKAAEGMFRAFQETTQVALTEESPRLVKSHAGG